MAKFANKNTKNASISHTFFELNYKYYYQILYKEDINSYSKLKSANNLLIKLRDLMIDYRKNFYYAQKLQKLGHNKNVKPKSYIFSNKV